MFWEGNWLFGDSSSRRDDISSHALGYFQTPELKRFENMRDGLAKQMGLQSGPITASN